MSNLLNTYKSFKTWYLKTKDLYFTISYVFDPGKSSCQHSKTQTTKSSLYFILIASCFLFTTTTTNIMTLKISLVLHIVLWLSIIFLIILHAKSKSPSTLTTTAPRHRLLNNSKTIASNFDFTPFLTHNHHHHQYKSQELGGSYIDPRYGVEKRLVPTGPNPLHH